MDALCCVDLAESPSNSIGKGGSQNWSCVGCQVERVDRIMAFFSTFLFKFDKQEVDFLVTQYNNFLN